MRITVQEHTGFGPNFQEVYEGSPAELEVYLRRAHKFLNREVLPGDLKGCIDALDAEQLYSVSIDQGADELAKHESFLMKYLREQGEPEELEKMGGPATPRSPKPAWTVDEKGWKDVEHWPALRNGYDRKLVPIVDIFHMGFNEEDPNCGKHHENCHEYVNKLAQALPTKPFPPVVAYHESDKNSEWKYVANDGNHRIAAALKLGLTHVPVALGRPDSIVKMEDNKSEQDLAKAHQGLQPQIEMYFDAARWMARLEKGVAQPITSTNPDEIAPRDPSSNPGFQQWFAGSKAVHWEKDPSGKDRYGQTQYQETTRPLVAFHGTAKDFTKFNTKRTAGPKQQAKKTWAGELGSWFTAPSKYKGNYDPGNAEFVAGSFTDDNRVGQPYNAVKEGGRVIPVHLAIKNPAEFEGYEHLMDEAAEHPTWGHFRTHLESLGHDGVVVRNSDTDGNVDRDDWVAFHPHQIKSAIGNSGAFDPANPHIGKSEPVAPFQARQALLKADGDVEAAALAAYSLPFTEESLHALRGLVGASSLTKAEEQVLPVPLAITPAHPDASTAVEEIERAFKAGAFRTVQLNGKHSKGSAIGKDPETKHLYLLKPGSGDNSPAQGVHEETASQSRREAAFWHVADMMGLGEWIPRCDLVYIDGREVAALRMLPLTFQNLGTALKEDPTLMPKLLRPYLVSGILHKWSALYWILGEPDGHSQNAMIDVNTKQVRLIDHGSSMAGRSFDPARDDDSFIPYFLRVWSGVKFNQMDVQQRLRQMPTAGIDGEKALARWLQELDPQRLAAKLQGYGIDPEPMVERLEQLQMSPGAKDITLNRLWLGLVDG